MIINIKVINFMVSYIIGNIKRQEGYCHLLSYFDFTAIFNIILLLIGYVFTLNNYNLIIEYTDSLKCQRRIEYGLID